MAGLVRAIDIAAAGASGCATEPCVHEPTFRVATPVGELDFCDVHADEAIASLPEEWLAQWAAIPYPVLDAPDGVPF